MTKVLDTQDVLAGSAANTYGFVATNDGGGTEEAVVDGVSYDNIFEWMNAQSK